MCMPQLKVTWHTCFLFLQRIGFWVNILECAECYHQYLWGLLSRVITSFLLLCCSFLEPSCLDKRHTFPEFHLWECFPHRIVPPRARSGEHAREPCNMFSGTEKCLIHSEVKDSHVGSNELNCKHSFFMNVLVLLQKQELPLYKVKYTQGYKLLTNCTISGIILRGKQASIFLGFFLFWGGWLVLF